MLSKHGISYADNGQKMRNTKRKVNIEIWGSGKPTREFLWSEDMADACVYTMENISFQDVLTSLENKKEIKNTHLNIGTGKEISIKELADMIKKTIGFEGDFYFNTEKPDGTMRKLTDTSKMKSLGWEYEVELKEGIQKLYNWYLK